MARYGNRRANARAKTKKRASECPKCFYLHYPNEPCAATENQDKSHEQDPDGK